MKPPSLVPLVCALLFGSAAYVALASESSTASTPAQVTMTVTNFRSWTSTSGHEYTDATTALAPHAVVTLVDEEGLPTFHMKRAATLEIAVESAIPGERYKALGVYFEQRGDGQDIKKDSDGSINFSQSHSANGTLLINNRFLHRGRDGHYEFFVVIQRESDGEIGVIDPGVKNEPTEG